MIPCGVQSLATNHIALPRLQWINGVSCIIQAWLMTHTCNPSTWGLRQKERHKFKAILRSIASSSQPGLHSEALTQKVIIKQFCEVSSLFFFPFCFLSFSLSFGGDCVCMYRCVCICVCVCKPGCIYVGQRCVFLTLPCIVFLMWFF